jgi:hypothetical protein
MNQYRCDTCEHHENITDAFYNTIWCKKHDVTINPATINLVGCASHSDFQSERVSVVQDEDGHIEKRPIQSERETHWRDLFVSDLRSLITWDAEHGNPELFKAVVTLNKHYNTFSVEQHDKQERNKVLDNICEWLKYNNPKGLYHYIQNELRQQAGEQG